MSHRIRVHDEVAAALTTLAEKNYLTTSAMLTQLVMKAHEQLTNPSPQTPDTPNTHATHNTPSKRPARKKPSAPITYDPYWVELAETWGCTPAEAIERKREEIAAEQAALDAEYAAMTPEERNRLTVAAWNGEPLDNEPPANKHVLKGAEA